MKILIKNCNLISMSEKREKYEENIDVLIDNSKIVEIGKNISINSEDLKVIDASGKVLMPGLINTHSHISMSVFRETVDGLKTQDWLTQKIWPMEDKLTNNDIYYATLLSCLEMIQTGCTTINDMYFMTEQIIEGTVGNLDEFSEETLQEKIVAAGADVTETIQTEANKKYVPIDIRI